jgi:hypothetical protein
MPAPGASSSGKVLHLLVVVAHPGARQLVLGERHMTVVVEVAPERRHPGKPPAHALLIGFNLSNWRARNHRERYVAMRQVHRRAIEMVTQKPAARAALLPPGAEHEVIDDQLAAAIEEVCQRHLAVRPVKYILLLDLLPGQLASLPA